MRAVLVSPAWAPSFDGGAGIFLKVNVTLLKEIGFNVTLICCKEWKYDTAKARTMEDYLDHVEIISFSNEKQRSGFSGRDDSFLRLIEKRFPTKYREVLEVGLHSKRVAAEINRLQPDIVIAYSMHSFAALMEVKNYPLLFVVTQPPRLNYLYQTWLITLRVQKPLKDIKSLLMIPMHFWIYKKLEIQLTNKATHVTSTDVTQAEYFSRVLKRKCSAYRSPTPDILTQRRICKNKSVKRIVCIGKLASTQSTSSFIFLRKVLIKPLVRKIKEPFEIHLLGGTEFQEPSKGLERYPQIILRGHIEDIEPELKAADVVLFASTLPYGYSARVRTALCVGCVLVLHKNVLGTFPELEPEYNCLVAKTESEFIAAIERSFNDEELSSRLKKTARKTYEECFSMNSARDKLKTTVYHTMELHKKRSVLF